MTPIPVSTTRALSAAPAALRRKDVGGIPSFEEFIEAMAKPRHPDRHLGMPVTNVRFLILHRLPLTRGTM